MFKRKLTVTTEQVREITTAMREELALEVNRVIEERHKETDETRIDNLYSYQHALEHSMMNLSSLSYRIISAAR